jgi:hypothetical protein
MKIAYINPPSAFVTHGRRVNTRNQIAGTTVG